MRLYLLDRVQAVTAAHPSLQAELQTALGRRERLGQTQQARTLARRAELLAQAEKLKPEMRWVPTTDGDRLMDLAAEARSRSTAGRERRGREGEEGPDQEGPDQGGARSLDSAVNMVRHEYTNYETLLEEMPQSRDVGTNILIYHSVKRRTLEMIAGNMPQLREACLRQIAALPA